MKIPSAILTLSFSLIGCLSFADQMTVSIDGFADPTSFAEVGGSLNLRVSELVPSDGVNDSTHILIEGLSAVEEGTLYYASTYFGLNVDSGVVQDEGVILLEMPDEQTLPVGAVASPVVGVVQRAGDWSAYGLTFPVTSVGGSSGDGDYVSGTISLLLTRDAEAFTGTTTYTVIDEDTLDLEAFTLAKDGGASYQMSATTLLRDGDRFYGTLTNLSEGAAYDSLLFSLTFTDIPDLDGDGIPDISDGEITSDTWAGYPVDSIGWVNTGAWLGFVNVSAGDYVYSNSLSKYIYLPESFVSEAGAWTFVPGYSGTGVEPGWAGYAIEPGEFVNTTTWMGYVNVSGGDWVYAYALSKYIYLPESFVSEAGSWTYVGG